MRRLDDAPDPEPEPAALSLPCRSFFTSGTYFSFSVFFLLPLLPSSSTSFSFAPMPSSAGRACGRYGCTGPLPVLLAPVPSFQPIPLRSAAPNCETGTRS